MFSAQHSFFSTQESVATLPMIVTANVARGSFGGSANSIRIEVHDGSGTIDWGDGTNVSITTTGTYSKTYSNNTSLKTITIASDTGIGFGFRDANRVTDVVDWGTIPITNAQSMFSNNRVITNFTSTRTPNFSGSVSTALMFANCTVFNQNIGSWNMSAVANTSLMFRNAGSFNNGGNSSIGNWNVSNVTNMNNMFQLAGQFNQPIGNWNVSNVETMVSMFASAGQFNQPIGGWQPLNLTNAVVMFSSATAFNNGGNSSWAGWSSATKLANTNGMFRFTGAFNQPVSEINMANVVDAGAMFSQANVFNNGGSNSINNWNVSNITNMSSMFQLTPAFNQPLNNWNTSKVTDMTNMFADANTFNRDLGGWNVANVTSHQAMFQRATLFNNGGNTLASWNMANTLSTRFMFNGSSSLNQPMPRWNLSNVADINADSMFANATSFNQDLSGWCVPQLTTQPASFATNTPAWTLAKPVWGTCPP